jgi:hypothetical protein
LLIGPYNDWATVLIALHVIGAISCVVLLKDEIYYIKFYGFKTYIASFWNVADLALIVLYFSAFLPLHYINESSTFEDEKRLVIIMLILLTFVKINQSLKIFDSFSFLVQMVQGVFYDLRLFLAYYIMMITTFAVIFTVIFYDPKSDSEGLGSFSFIIMSLRILWGEGSFDIEKTQYKFMAWMIYVLLMLCGNIVFMNFLIAVVQ